MNCVFFLLFFLLQFQRSSRFCFLLLRHKFQSVKKAVIIMICMKGFILSKYLFVIWSIQIVCNISKNELNSVLSIFLGQSHYSVYRTSCECNIQRNNSKAFVEECDQWWLNQAKYILKINFVFRMHFKLTLWPKPVTTSLIS